MTTPQVLTLSVVLMTALAACDEGKTPSPPPGKTGEGTIVALGDSLSEGYLVDAAEAYPARLESMLRQAGYRYRVVNRGWSGETSGETLARTHEILRAKPDIVILETGANDGFLGYPVETIRDNIDEAIRVLKKGGATVVLAGMKMTPFLQGPQAAAFDALYPELARRHDLVLIPFFLEAVAGRGGLVQWDGVHPTAEGYRAIAERIFPYVAEAIDRHRNASHAGR